MSHIFLSTHGKLNMFQAQLLASPKTAGNSQICVVLQVNMEELSSSPEQAQKAGISCLPFWLLKGRDAQLEF